MELILANELKQPMVVEAYSEGNMMLTIHTRLKAAETPNLVTRIMIGTIEVAVVPQEMQKMDPMQAIRKDKKKETLGPMIEKRAPEMM